MKKIIQPLIIAISSLVFLASCNKEESREIFLGGKVPVLAASVTGSIPLAFATENNPAVRFNWTNPEYGFASGVSSQDVAYTLEIDVAGASFSGPNKKAISVSKELSIAYTQKEFNIILSDLQLKLNTPASIEVRVIASLGSAVTNLTSNVMRFNVTPFAPPPKVPVPTMGTLWIIGDAVASGWNNPLPAPFVTNQRFTKVTDTQYELVVALKPGGYKLIQENGVWGTQYHMVEGTASGGTFQRKDSDPAFPGPATPGNYKIVVDFQAGRFTVTKQ